MTAPVHEEPTVRLYHGDCMEVLAEFAEASVDAVVTDPPYGLEFMGKDWDRFRMDPRAARWSGGASGASGSFATSHLGTTLPAYTKRRTTSLCRTCGKRDAFRNPHSCRDAADWTTIPVDEVPIELRAFQNWCHTWALEVVRVLKPGAHVLAFGGARTHHRLICALEDAGLEIRDCLMWLYGSGFPKSLDVSTAIMKAAGVDGGRQWAGWGTALKPAWEPIVLARKALGESSIAANVLRHGTGGLNVDGCRTVIDGDSPTALRRTYGYTPNLEKAAESEARGRLRDRTDPERKAAPHPSDDLGRWPANLVLDAQAAAQLDEQSGEVGGNVATKRPGAAAFSSGDKSAPTIPSPSYGDSGGASRFFYTAKADAEDRDGSTHPTIKPVDLMKWLVRLVTPPGGVVLDPFMGSGTTIYVARELGFRAIGIEREVEYVEDARRRLRQGVLPFALALEREGRDG